MTFFRQSCPGAPKRARAVAANDFCCMYRLGVMLVVVLQDFTASVVLDAMTVISSSSTSVCII